MTIPATSRVSPIYQGDASATAFAFSYKTYSKAELQVIVSDGVTPQTLVLDSDYSVALNGDQTTSPGGSITYPISGSPLAVGLTLVIVSNVPNEQDVSLPTGGAFNASTVELAFDRQQVQLQQFNDTLNRTIRVPAGEIISSALPAALTRANYLLGFDSLGNPVAVAAVNGSAASLAIDLTSATVATKGAGQVGFMYSLAYAAGTVGRWLKDLATSAGATFIGLIQAGAGAVLRTIQDKLRETVSVIDYGGVLNDSSAGARTANTAAIAAALLQRKRPFIPEGSFWIASNTPLAAFWDIEGAGAEASIIKGDGDLFSVTSADNGEMRRFRNLKIMNDVTKGKLFKYVSAVDTNRLQFDNVNFDKANYHIHASGGGAVVSPSFNNCRFINASIESRHFEGLWVYSETSCYTWYCGIGLRCTNGAVSTCSIRGSTYEQMDDSAIVMDASNTSYEVAGLTITGTHFEANGKVNHNADVQLLTSAATRLRGIKLLGCGFFTPTATQSFRVSVAAGGGGNIDNVEIDGGECMGIVPLCTDTPLIKVRNVYYQSVAPQPTNLVPLQVQYQYSQRTLGEMRVSGVEVGSGGTVATLTAPVGVRDWRVTVSGNSYNGVPNSNTALNVTYMSGTTANTRALTDVNHSVGANQGFIVTYNSGTRLITVTNKAAMTNTQSGEVLAEFFS